MGEAKVSGFQCAESADIHFDWGCGAALELCSLGQDSHACKFDPSSLDFPARRVAHAIAPLYRKLNEEKLKGTVSPEYLAAYANKVSKSLMEDQFDLANVKDVAALQLFHEKAIWELLKIFFVDEIDASTSIAQALTEWLRKFHILYAESSAPPLSSEVERLKASERPDADPAYWPLLQRISALGWLQETYDLLTNHSVFATSYAEQQRNPNLRAQYEVVDSLARLLAKMPIWGNQGSNEESIGRPVDQRAEFLAEREAWLSEVTDRLLQDAELWRRVDLHSRAAAEGLQQVVATLCGYPEAAGESTSSWLELLVAQLQHSFPGLTLNSGLPTLLDRCLSEKGASDGWQLSTLQQLLEAICDDAVQNVVQICSNKFSPWLMAHIPDLLLTRPSSRPVLEQNLPHLGCTQVESYVLEYGTALSSGPTTWELAFDYFAQCPRYGGPSTVALVEFKMQTKDRRIVRKLIQICQKYGLQDLKSAVLEVQGQICLQGGRIGEALSWLLQMDNLAPAQKAAADVLLATLEPTPLHSFEKLRQLGGLEPLLANALEGRLRGKTPLALMKSYLQLARSTKDTTDVSEALLSLLQSEFSWLTPSVQKQSTLLLGLLFQAIPLLELIPPRFTLTEVNTIRQAQQKLGQGGLPLTSQTTRTSQAVCLAIERLYVRAHLHQAD